jgi:hypothetical protein
MARGIGVATQFICHRLFWKLFAQCVDVCDSPRACMQDKLDGFRIAVIFATGPQRDSVLSGKAAQKVNLDKSQ